MPVPHHAFVETIATRSTLQWPSIDQGSSSLEGVQEVGKGRKIPIRWESDRDTILHKLRYAHRHSSGIYGSFFTSSQRLLHTNEIKTQDLIFHVVAFFNSCHFQHRQLGGPKSMTGRHCLELWTCCAGPLLRGCHPIFDSRYNRITSFNCHGFALHLIPASNRGGTHSAPLTP